MDRCCAPSYTISCTVLVSSVTYTMTVTRPSASLVVRMRMPLGVNQRVLYSRRTSSWMVASS